MLFRSRISHASHIDKPVTMSLALAKGKLAPFTVQPLPDAPPQYAEPQPVPEFETVDELRDYFVARQRAGASPTELDQIKNTATQMENN